MNWLKKIFGSQKEYASHKEHMFYRNIEQLLLSNKLLVDCRLIYNVGSITYSAVNNKELLDAINKDDLHSFIDSVGFDAREDLIDVYLMEYERENKLITVFNPIELYNNPQLLNVVNYAGNTLQLSKKLIYQASN